MIASSCVMTISFCSVGVVFTTFCYVTESGGTVNGEDSEYCSNVITEGNTGTGGYYWKVAIEGSIGR